MAMRIVGLGVVFFLAGCAPVSLGHPMEEVIEGDPAAYPAFEVAARSCAFHQVRKVANGRGGSHFLIAYTTPMSAEAACLFDWLDRNSEGRLVRSAH